MAHISELVEMERRWMTQSDVYAQAEELMDKRPDVLLHRIVQHIQRLFEIKSGVQGILPKINELYTFNREMATMLENVRSLLKVKPGTSSATCVQLLEREIRLGSGSNDAQAKPEELANDLPNYVMTPDHDREVHGARVVREMSQVIKELKQEVGASTMDEIVPRVKRLMIMLSAQA